MADAREIEQRLSILLFQTRNRSVALGMPRTYLENFLWDMEEYFKAACAPEGEKVRITSMYLTGDANKLWWRRRMEDDAYAGRPKIERWEVLKKELKDQFLPCKTAWVARDSLKKLKHTGTGREYVKELSSFKAGESATIAKEAE